MLTAILGTKLTQSQSFTADGRRIATTSVLAGPCFVVNVKTKEKDGYNAIQLGLGTRRVITVTRPVLGNLKKAGLEKSPPRFLKEVRLSDLNNPSTSLRTSLGDLTPGMVIKIGEVFTAGDTVSVTGVSKGKGFAGVVKRYHFKGGPRTHGQSDRERAPGAIGSTTTPGRVYKGKRMAGRMGSDTVTIKNLKVVTVDGEKNILTLSGLIPGGRNGLLVIKKISS